MRELWQWIAIGTIGVAGQCAATDLDVLIADERGQPVADAVVTVLAESEPSNRATPPAGAATTKVIDQKNETFVPYIEIFRPGDSVVFSNSDRTRHHAYSFSPVKAFEFVVAPGQRSPPVVLDKSGVVAVGCNIHDQMITYLYISDAPWIAQSRADGVVRFSEMPAGAYNVRVWHPRLRPGLPDLAQLATIVPAAQSKAIRFKLALLPDPRLQFDREHTRY